jgi:hypothetical protein
MQDSGEKNRSDESKKAHAGLISFRGQPFYFEDIDFKENFLRTAWERRQDQFHGLYQDYFRYKIYLLNSEIELGDEEAKILKNNGILFSIQGNLLTAYFILHPSFIAFSLYSEKIKKVTIELDPTEHKILNEEYLYFGQKNDGHEEKNEQPDLENFVLEKKEQSSKVLEILIMKLVASALDFDRDHDEEISYPIINKDDYFIGDKEQYRELNIIIDLINELTLDEVNNISLESIFDYFSDQFCDTFHLHEFPFFHHLIFQRAKQDVYYCIRINFYNYILDKMMSLPSCEEMAESINEREGDNEEFVFKQLHEIDLDSTCAALERAYIVSTLDKSPDGIEFFGSDKMVTCIAGMFRQVDTGVMVNAHISHENSTTCILDVLNEFDFENEESPSILQVRLCGGMVNNDTRADYSDYVLTNLIINLLHAAHIHHFQIDLLSADIFSKLIHYRDDHKRTTRDFSVGNLFDRQGRVVCVYDELLHKYLPYTGKSRKFFLGDEEHKNVWLSVLSAFGLPVGSMLKIYDNRSPEINANFLNHAEKTLRADFARRLVGDAIGRIAFSVGIVDNLLINLVDNEIDEWLRVWEDNFFDIIPDDKQMFYGSNPFTYHFLQSVIYKVYQKSEFQTPLSAKECECVFYNLLTNNGFVKDFIYKNLFSIFAELLMSRGFRGHTREIIDLLREIDVCPWYLYDEMEPYQSDLLDDPTGLLTADSLITSLLNHPEGIQGIMHHWQNATLIEAVEKIIQSSFLNSEGTDESAIDCIRTELLNCGKPVLHFLHHFSSVQPSLSALTASLIRIINIQYSDNVNCFGSGKTTEDIKQQLISRIQAWFKIARTSNTQDLQLLLDQVEQAKMNISSIRDEGSAPSCCHLT